MRARRALSILAGLCLTAAPHLTINGAFAASAAVPTVHALSLYDTPMLPEDFDHLPFANPDAPRGGTLTRAVVGSFNSTNPFIIRGDAAAGFQPLGGGYIYDTLMYQNPAEPFTMYGQLAAGIRLDPARRWVEFDIDSRARFHDGKPLTAEDVAFTFELLRKQGAPLYRGYYADVTGVEVLSPYTIRFDFAAHNSRELPLILGQMPILPKHYWEHRDFTRPTLDAPLGSGPYRVASIDAGRRIVYQRVDDYWGKDLPVSKGRFNIDRLVFDYYLDDSVALEAFRSGDVDLRTENTAKNWATAYGFEAVKRGLVKRIVIPSRSPAPMQGFVMNLRRDVFQDRRVREALTLAFDFDWLNRNLFYGLYARTRGYFDESPMEAKGLPSEGERELLEPWREQLPSEVFNQPLPIDEPEELRPRLKKALGLLREAGYEVHDNRLINTATGQPLSFEILLYDTRLQRMVLPLVRNLARLGIEARIRVVDVNQYIVRRRQHDYDMTTDVIAQSDSPGNEQREYWTSAYADQPQSRNTIGLKSPVIDDLVEKLIRASSREELNTRARALDRVLRWGFYVIPQYHSQGTRMAYWNKFGFVEPFPPYGFDLDSWWVRPERAARIEAAQHGE